MNPVATLLKSKINCDFTESPSPLAVWLKGTLREVDEGIVTVEFTIREEMTNPIGTLHGGMYAAIIDDVIGVSVYSLGLDTFYTTINLSIDYLSAIKKGEKLLAKGKVIRQGSSIINAECSLFNMNNKLLAKGSSNLAKTNIRT